MKTSISSPGIILLTLFLALSLLVSLGVFLSIDYQAIVFLQQLLPSFLITPFSLFSVIGSFETATIFFLILLLSVKILRSFWILSFYGLVTLIEVIGKTIIAQNPPPLEFLKTNLHVGFPSGQISQHFFSFPSGHSARTAFISGILIVAVLLSKKFNKSQRQILIGLILIFDLVMLLSRVYLGEHWLTDVVGGALLGFALALLGMQMSSKRA